MGIILDELLEQKEELFNRPTSTKKVIGNRSEIEVKNFFDLGAALSQRAKNQVLVYTGKPIIPPNFYSAQNFSKRGALVFLNTFNGSERKLIENEQSELKARISASEKYKRENGPYVGWAWIDPEKIWHVVRPSVTIEGHRLHHYAWRSPTIRDRIKVYNTRDSPWNTATLEVPSRSTNEAHKVTLEHIPRIGRKEKFAEWTRIRSRHDCDAKRHDFTFRFNGNITTYCSHDVAAYLAYSRKGISATGEVIPQIFPWVTEPFLRTFLGASYNMVIKDTFRENGKKRVRSRIPSFAEIDPILMDTWLNYGNKQTCFVRNIHKQYKTGPPIGQRKRMSQYSWFDNNAPGIAFGNE
ncbi:MAG: hypothetical protein AABW79_03740 [Nanoarchaeota archaeon]